LTAQAKKAGFRVLTIVVQTDKPTAQQRAMKRSEAKAGDQYKQPLTAEEFAKQEQACQAPRVDASTAVISGKHTYTTQARMVLKKMIETQNARGGGAVTSEARPSSIVRSRGPFIQ
jgi:hypothetical protein